MQRSIWLLIKGKPFLNKQSLLSLYYSYIHSYINYANVAWGSTYITNLKELSSRQKHAMHIFCNKWKFEHTKQLFQSNKILNVYKLNIVNVTTFMYKVNPKTAPNINRNKNRLILILLDSRNLTTYNQPTTLKQVNIPFQLEDHISGIAFSVPKRNKSLLCINLKL